VKVTWYACSRNRYLLVLANRTDAERKTTIDVSCLKPGTFMARNEYKNTNVSVKDGKFEVSIPARNFILIGF
jgi:hypothetical protein